MHTSQYLKYNLFNFITKPACQIEMTIIVWTIQITLKARNSTPPAQGTFPCVTAWGNCL